MVIFPLRQFSEKHGQGAQNDPGYNVLTQQPRSLEPQASTLCIMIWVNGKEEFSQNNCLFALKTVVFSSLPNV